MTLGMMLRRIFWWSLTDYCGSFWRVKEFQLPGRTYSSMTFPVMVNQYDIMMVIDKTPVIKQLAEGNNINNRSQQPTIGFGRSNQPSGQSTIHHTCTTTLQPTGQLTYQPTSHLHYNTATNRPADKPTNIPPALQQNSAEQSTTYKSCSPHRIGNATTGVRTGEIQIRQLDQRKLVNWHRWSAEVKTEHRWSAEETNDNRFWSICLTGNTLRSVIYNLAPNNTISNASLDHTFQPGWCTFQLGSQISVWIV